MKRQRGVFLTVAGMVCLLAVLGTGCSDDKVSTAEEEKMKKQMSEKFDINSVPPEHRERVRGFMSMGGSRPPSATASGTGAVAPAPGPASKP